MPNPISRMSVRPQGHRASTGWVLLAAIAAAGFGLARIASAAPAEDGYRLWLRYVPVESEWLARYRASATEHVGTNVNTSAAGGARSDGSPTLRAAQAELLRGLTGLLGTPP